MPIPYACIYFSKKQERIFYDKFPIKISKEKIIKCPSLIKQIKCGISRHQWLIAIILVTKVADIWRIVV
jgi:hypothetical protein